MSTVIIVLLLVVVAAIVILNAYFSWIRGGVGGSIPQISVDCPPCPKCPPLPIYPEPTQVVLGENKNLKSMVRYLSLVLKKFEAEQEIYKLSNGYHQVYNSPKMEYLKKEIYRMIKGIKADPEATLFFERNLSGVLA